MEELLEAEQPVEAVKLGLCCPDGGCVQEVLAVLEGQTQVSREMVGEM